MFFTLLNLSGEFPLIDQHSFAGRLVAIVVVVLVELVVVVSATSRSGSASSPHAAVIPAIETIRVIRANERRIGGETIARAADVAWWASPRVRSALI